MARTKQEVISEMVDSGLFSDDEIRQAASTTGSPEADNRGLIKKGWDALAIPEQKSREGLQMLAGAVPNPEPTGQEGIISKGARMAFPLLTSAIPKGTLGDLGRGTPKIMADTMAQAAPGFVSRGAILGAGASMAAQEAAPLAKMMLRGIGEQGESMSGIAPKAEGALEAAYKDPFETRNFLKNPPLMFDKGKKAASEFYEAGKDELNAAKDTYRATSVSGNTVNMEKTADIFSGKYKPEDILDKANEFISGGGKLEPAEALKVRKAIDVLLRSKNNVPDELYKMRGEYDAMAKASKNLSEADKLHQRGMQAEALRNVFPQNKYGGASSFKTMLMGLGRGVMAPLLSPMAQGAAATGAGVMARQAAGPLAESPRLAAALVAALQQRRKAQ